MKLSFYSPPSISLGGCSSQRRQIPGRQARICAGDTREAYYCGRNGRRARRGPAARRCSTRLGSIKSAKRAGEQTQLAERRRKRSSGDPVLPGAYALWAVRAGRSVRNIYRAKVFPPLDFPHTKTSPREGSREPRLTRTRAGFLFNHPSHRWHTEAVGSSTQIR
jgi:CubicO group peptidase (beta-lactamase class C family)